MLTKDTFAGVIFFRLLSFARLSWREKKFTTTGNIVLKITFFNTNLYIKTALKGGFLLLNERIINGLIIFFVLK